jgi:hypothetical protein
MSRYLKILKIGSGLKKPALQRPMVELVDLRVKGVTGLELSLFQQQL